MHILFPWELRIANLRFMRRLLFFYTLFWNWRLSIKRLRLCPRIFLRIYPLYLLIRYISIYCVQCCILWSILRSRIRFIWDLRSIGFCRWNWYKFCWKIRKLRIKLLLTIYNNYVYRSKSVKYSEPAYINQSSSTKKATLR